MFLLKGGGVKWLDQKAQQGFSKFQRSGVLSGEFPRMKSEK